MFERYTEGARRTLFFARYAASQFGGTSIDPEHLLLGLIRDPPSRVMGELLARAHVSPERIRTEIERVMVTREKVSTSVEIPFSRDTKEILNRAASEADYLQSAAIDNEHLLLGILRAEHTQAAAILIRLGLHLGNARKDILRVHEEATKSSVTQAARVPTQVRIVPTRRTDQGISTRGRDGSLEMEGFSLRAALSRLCHVHETRIELVAAIDEHARYDFSAVWSLDEGHDAGDRLIQEGIEHHFHVRMAFEGQWQDVYVLTAPNGTSAPMTEMLDLGGRGISFSGFEFTTTGSLQEPRLDSGAIISDLSASNATLEELCHTLEPAVDRLVVDETHLEGRFNFHVPGHVTTIDELREVLQTYTQLVLTPAKREVTMLVVRPIGQESP